MFQCPPDRKISFTFDEPNQFFKEQYSELRVNCQWQRFGCDEKKMIGQEEQHEQHRPLILLLRQKRILSLCSGCLTLYTAL